MKKIKVLTLIFLFMIFNNGSCDDDTITGSASVVEITHVSFSNLTREITPTSLVVSGTIMNSSSSSTIAPPWKIECQFYIFDDDIATNKLLGGDQTNVNHSLSPGTALDWSLEIEILNPNDYVDYTVEDLRAIQ